MKSTGRNIRHAFTLVEMMMTVGCGSLMLAAVTTAGVALQRSFAAVEGYSVAEGDQLRVLDYIAMDCRRGLSASVANNTLTVTVPVYYDYHDERYHGCDRDECRLFYSKSAGPDFECQLQHYFFAKVYLLARARANLWDHRLLQHVPAQRRGSTLT